MPSIPFSFPISAAGFVGSAAFVSFSPEPETAERGGHNHFGVLFNALTFDAWIVMGILIIASFAATRRVELVPRGMQNFMEMVLEQFLSLLRVWLNR